MSSDSAKTLESMVLAGLPVDRIATEEELRTLVDGIGKILNVQEDERRAVANRIMERQRIRMDTGVTLATEHKPWLAARRPSLEPFFWDRYFKFLERERWPRQVLLGLD